MARLSDKPAEALQKLRLLYYRDKDITAIKPIFVSRMPRHKVTGAAHKATVKGARHLDEGIALYKTDLVNLKLDKNTGEIVDYYEPDSDRLLYNALKAGQDKKVFLVGNLGFPCLDYYDEICTSLDTGLPAEIAARQKQYEYYRDKLLTFKEHA